MLGFGAVALGMFGRSRSRVVPLLMEETEIRAVGVAAVCLKDVVGKEDIGYLVLFHIGNNVLGEIA